MQKSECKMQNEEKGLIEFSFSILHSDFPIEL
jgi:hypothetical protein